MNAGDLRRTRRTGALGAAACALAAAGCGRGRDVEARDWRWIDPPPIYAVAPSDLREVDCVASFDLDADGFPAGLELVEGSRLDRPGGGLTVRGGWVPPRLALTRPLPGADSAAIRLVLTGLRAGDVKVRWAELDGPARGETTVHKSAGTGALRDQFLVELGEEPGRVGRVHLELEPTTAAGEIVTLSELCVGRIRRAGDRLEGLARVPWKVTLAGDTRDALLVPPAGEVARRGRLARGARIEFGLGRLAGPPAAALVSVVRRRPDAAEEKLGEARVTAEELGVGWKDLAFDLTGAGGEAELAIRVEPDGGAGDLVVALSAPRVSARRRGDERPNIVLVSIDTLRADHLSIYGYERPTSPRIDAWARDRATVFRRVVAPSSWTLPSHFSLFTGIDGFAHPANHNSISIDASAYRFLAAQLLEAGYRTRAVTGGAYVSPDYGLARGFESFRWWERKDLRDRELPTHLESVHRWLDSEPEGPFFLFFHTYEVHTPNPGREPWFSRFHGGPDDRVVDLGPPDPPDPAAGFLGVGHFVARRVTSPETERLGAADASLPRDAYDSNIAYADELLGPLLDRLSRPPFGERTLVAIVSDHGESLGDEGRAGHALSSLDNLLVPMLVAMPGGATRGREVATQVRLHDLYPTLLEAAGVPVPDGLDAKSLSALLRGESEAGRPAYAYVATTNRGLSLLTPDGLKVDWLNSPWRALAGRFQWSRVEGFAERPLAAPPAADEGARSEQSVQAAYDRRAPGLRLELVPGGTEPLEVEVVTELVDPVGVKIPRADAAPLDWVDVGRLRGTVAPERPLRVHFERIPSRQLALALRVRWPGCADAVETEVQGSAETLGRAVERRLAPVGCADGVPRQPAVLVVRWQGPVPSSDWLPADRELVEDLRALGYVH